MKMTRKSASFLDSSSRAIPNWMQRQLAESGISQRDAYTRLYLSNPNLRMDNNTAERDGDA